MSIDLYPALDAGETDVAVALERDPTAGTVAPLGAASLLYQNDDARWGEDQNDDLVSRYPGITMQNLATDAATIGDVFGEQLAQVAETWTARSSRSLWAATICSARSRIVRAPRCSRELRMTYRRHMRF